MNIRKNEKTNERINELCLSENEENNTLPIIRLSVVNKTILFNATKHEVIQYF